MSCAAALAGIGLYELLKKFPGESVLKVMRQVLVSISDGIERGITVACFFISLAALSLHTGKVVYDYFQY